MESSYRVHELAPNNWAIVNGSVVELCDLTMDQANAALAVILDAEAYAYEVANEAEREAEECRRREALACEEAERLRAQLSAITDAPRLRDLAAKAQAVHDAVERFVRDVRNLRDERAGNKAGTRCPPFIRQALDRIIESSGNELRKLTYFKPETHRENSMA